MTMPTQLFFNQLLISMNLHQLAQIHNFLSFCSGNTIDLNILQPHWPGTLVVVYVRLLGEFETFFFTIRFYKH